MTKIIWINGAFGSGKTQTAYELNHRMTDSYIYDPEKIGYFIFKNVPEEIKKSDFQDYSQWRNFNYDMIKHIAETYDGVIIVPMTIVVPQYYDEIIGKLLADGFDLQHFILCASKEVIHKRLKKRLDGGRWSARQTDRCLDAFDNKIDGIRIDTETIPVKVVAEQIAAECQIKLKDIKRGFIDRIKTQIRHIHRF